MIRSIWVGVGVFLIAGSAVAYAATPAQTQVQSALSARDQETLKVLSPKAYQLEVMRTDYDAHIIDLQKFQALAREPGTVILDLREAEAYQRSHIKGAKHLGADAEEKRLAKLVPSKDTTVLLYCTNSLYLTRMISQTQVALPQLLALGYKKTYMLDDAARHAAETMDRTMLLPMVSGADEKKQSIDAKDKQ